jgi:hypothetical protein
MRREKLQFRISLTPQQTYALHRLALEQARTFSGLLGYLLEVEYRGYFKENIPYVGRETELPGEDVRAGRRRVGEPEARRLSTRL